MDKWYVARGDATKGPFTIGQLRGFVEKGQLRATDMLRREGSDDWVAASTFSVFFPTQDAEVPPPVVTPATEEWKATPIAEVTRTAALESSPPIVVPAKVEKPAAASKSRAQQKPKPLNVEMHIYGTGGHGGSIFANRKSHPFSLWPQRFVEWATDLGMMPAAKG